MAEQAGDFLEADDVRILVDIGFMALSHGLADAADDVFAGVVAARPDQEAGHIGAALSRLHGGAIDEAIKILRQLPPTDTVQLFLGMAIARTGETTAARAILNDVAMTAPDTPQGASARQMLEALSA